MAAINRNFAGKSACRVAREMVICPVSSGSLALLKPCDQIPAIHPETVCHYALKKFRPA